jgi:hypothetical protein
VASGSSAQGTNGETGPSPKMTRAWGPETRVVRVDLEGTRGRADIPGLPAGPWGL